jgi:hypothetical protein
MKQLQLGELLQQPLADNGREPRDGCYQKRSVDRVFMTIVPVLYGSSAPRRPYDGLVSATGQGSLVINRRYHRARQPLK